MSYDDEVLADGPLLYLKLDETTGTTAADSSGNGRDATIYGSPTLGGAAVMPLGSTSVHLDTGQYVEVPNGSWMNQSNWTIEAWVRLDDNTDTHIIASRDGVDGLHAGWALYVNNSTAALTALGSDGGAYPGTASLDTDTGYLAAFTSDGKLYINGVLDHSYTGGTFSSSTTNPLTIGGSYFESGSTVIFPLVGDIDHVAYYDTVLTAGRLLAHFDASTPPHITIDGEAFGAPLTMLDGEARSIIVAGADTSNFMSGLSIACAASVTVTTAPSAGPTTALVDKAIALPTPTLVNGRPT